MVYTVCALTGLVVWCAIIVALVLAIGGNLHCAAERTGPIVVIACQSPVFGTSP